MNFSFCFKYIRMTSCRKENDVLFILTLAWVLNLYKNFNKTFNVVKQFRGNFYAMV
jgi:hypothetical protein